MKTFGIRREQFLKFLAALPFASLFGWDSNRLASTVLASSRSAEDSLKKLILPLGPWPASNRLEAEEFAERFLKSQHAGAYLTGSVERLLSLADRFPVDPLPLEEIDLGTLPSEERELLLDLVNRLYGLIEVRFAANHEPPWGECLGDLTRHTLPPKEPSKR
jgi:hypothetical protein